MKNLVRSSVWNLLGQGVPIAIALLVVPWLLKAVGDARYGFLTVVWVLVGYVGLFDFGVGKAMTRLVSERLGEGDSAGAAKVAKVAMLMLTGLGVLTALIFLAFASAIVGWLSVPADLLEEGVNALRLLALGLPFVMATAGYRGCLEACNRFGVLNAVRIVMGLFTYLAPLLAVSWSCRLEALVGSVILMRVLANILHQVLFRRYCQFGLSGSLPGDWRNEMKRLMAFGGWMTVSNIISPLMNSMDRLIIGSIVPVAQVGFYATAYDMASKVLMLPYSVTGAAFPALAGMKEADSVMRTYRLLFKALAALVLPVLAILALLSDAGFHAWLGARISEQAAPAFRVLLVGLFFNCVAQAPATLILSTGSPRWMALCHVAEAPCYLVLVLVLTSRLGIVGTALAWTIRAAVDACLLTWIAQRRLVPGAMSGTALACLLIAGAVMFLPAFCEGALWFRSLWLLVACGLAMVLAWFFVFDIVERAQVLRFVQWPRVEVRL